MRFAARGSARSLGLGDLILTITRILRYPRQIHFIALYSGYETSPCALFWVPAFTGC